MTEPNGGWLRHASVAEWFKALGIVIALVVAGVQLRQEVTALREDVQEIRADLRKEVQLNRDASREIQRDVSSMQRDQAGVKVLVEKIAEEQRDARDRK